MAEPTLNELADVQDELALDADERPGETVPIPNQTLRKWAAALRRAEEEIKRLQTDSEDWRKSYEVAREETRGECNRAEQAEAALAEMRSRFPEGMEHCTIQFKECEKGHGRLTATNWIDHGCPYCIISEVRQSLEELIVNIRSQRRLT